MLKALWVVVMGVAVGCGGESPAPTCEAGRVQSCPCAGGGQGVQECGPGGLAWSACVCASADAGADVADAGADGASDVSDAADAPTVDDAGRLPDGGCPAGWVVCAGSTCFDLATSSRFCGSCSYFCAAGSTCSGGRCVTAATGLSCETGRGDCDRDPASGCEVDTQTDRMNCGGCGRACVGAREVCFEGACVPR